MFSRVKHALANDEGIALVVVIGAIALISVFAVGGFAMANQAMHSTGQLQTEEMAFQVASSGMERELAFFNESLLIEAGGSSYQRSGSTPDGNYLVQVGRDPSVPFKYSIISRGYSKTEEAIVRQDFYFFDLWSTNVASQNNPAMGPVGSATQWNGNSTISGPFYVGGDCDFNSNVSFVGGPLFASGHIALQGGTMFTEVPTGSKYFLFAGKGAEGAPSNVKVYNTCPKIDLPWVDPDYMGAMELKSKEESSDNKRGSTVASAADTRLPNDEVATLEDPASYSSARAPGAASEYKYIPGDLTINALTSSFGKVTKVAGVATDWDDFAFDADTGTLYVEGVVFVDGDVEFGPGVSHYQGNGVIVSTGIVDLSTPSFKPVGASVNADNLTTTMCLALVADQDINLNGGTFEGIVFANGDFNISMNGTLMGAIHAHAINSLAPQTNIYMETNMNTALLPIGTPGSPSDPRGQNYGGGVVIPGTWSRMQ